MTPENLQLYFADSALGSERMAAALERSPSLGPFLRRMAKRAAQGKRLPESFSVKGLDYAAQGELEKLLGTTTGRQADGTVYGTLLPPLREASAWKGALAALGWGGEKSAEETVETFLTRLAWRVPAAKEFIDCLAATPEVSHYLKKSASRAQWRDLFLGVWNYAKEGVAEPTTLSQLGSRWLNDSKALRTGPLRRQLALMLTVLSGREGDERTVLGTYGIFDNPYTSYVTLFAPITFTTDKGDTFDFPARLFAAGLATTLPSETVQHIRAVEWRGDEKHLVTSENAAPFARYVAAKHPALYTEGYPNFAVQALLTRLGAAGVTAEHAGDADFDGFRIAAMVGRCLPLTRVRAAEVVRSPGDLSGIDFTEEQRARAQRFLRAFPNMPYAAEIALLLEGRGAWYEQESFPL